MSTRAELLQALIRFEQPIPQIMKELNSYPWNSRFSYATLTRGDIISILNRFVQSELSALDVCEWAEEMEGRVASDMERELGYNDLIRDVLNFLSTDQRAGYKFTPEDAKREIIRLNNTKYNPNDEPIRPMKTCCE